MVSTHPLMGSPSSHAIAHHEGQVAGQEGQADQHEDGSDLPQVLAPLTLLGPLLVGQPDLSQHQQAEHTGGHEGDEAAQQDISVQHQQSKNQLLIDSVGDGNSVNEVTIIPLTLTRQFPLGEWVAYCHVP